jgi:hypothetical protein
MSNNLCVWCQAREGNPWTQKINNKTHISIERFCSLKCKTQYEDRYSINWKKKSTNWVGIIIFIVILYYLLK